MKKQHFFTHKNSIEALCCIFFFFLILCTSQIQAFDWDTGLLHYWTMNESAGTTVQDVHGTGTSQYNGTVIGDNSRRTGKIGNGIYLDGDDWVNISAWADLPNGTENFTISLWVNSTAADGFQPLWGSLQANEEWTIEIVNDGNIYGYCNSNNINGQGKVSQDGTSWTHIVWVRNGTTDGGLFVNGTMVVGGAPASGTITAGNIALGREYNYNNLTGMLDEVGIWNRSLSTTEIDELYNSGAGLTYNEGALDATLSVYLDLPTNGSVISISSQNFTANYSYENMNISNATYYIWNSTDDIFNSTSISVLSSLNRTDINISGFTLDSYLWNVYSCGTNETDTICSWGSVGNYSFEVGATINSEVYPTSVFETENTNFRANITLIGGANLFAAKLVYNGTSYLATKISLGSNQYELVRNIDIPIIVGGEQNLTFYWNFEYRNGVTSSQNTTLRSHNVSHLVFGLVNASSTTPFVNFTVYNETERNLTNSKMDATFDYWLGKGDVKKTFSIDSTSEVGSYAFSLNTNRSVNVSSIINIQTDNYYYERTFYFNKERYNNTVTNQKLFLQDAGSSIIIQVRDSGLVPIEGYFVKVYRYYPSNDSYEIIERAKTDEYGQFVARLIEPNTIKYQFEFMDENNTIMKRTDDMTIACRTTICIIPFVIEDTTQDFERFENVTDYDWTFTFDNNTHIFTFTWNDVSGESVTNWLKVERKLFNGTTVVCNVTSIYSSGTLTCDVGDSEASYTAQVFRKVGSGSWRRIALLSKKVGITFLIYGKEALIWSLFLSMTAIAIGYWFPPVGMILFALTNLLLYMTKIIYVNPGVFIGELFIVVLLCWAFGGKK